MVPRTNPIRGAYSSPIPGYDRIDPPKQAPLALARSIPPLAAALLAGAHQPQARLPLGVLVGPPGPATRQQGLGHSSGATPLLHFKFMSGVGAQ